MADQIVWIDGFDHMSSAQTVRKYETAFAGITSGRFGGQAVVVSTASQMMRIFPATSQAWRIGIAVYLNIHNGGTFSMLRIRDGASDQVELGINSLRQIRITRNATQIGVSTDSLQMQQWYYIEWYVVITNSTGVNQCVVRVGNSEVLNLTGVDTQNTANAFADRVIVTAVGGNSIYYDDFVISTMDVTNSPTFLGEMRVVTLYPNENGTYSDFTGSDGNSADNYQLVDEQNTINDADYVASDTVGHRDSYNMENLGFSPLSIPAVQITSSLYKSDAGAKTARLFSRINGTDYESADISPLSSVNSYSHLMEQNPDTTSAWTETDVNNIEVGVKVQA